MQGGVNHGAPNFSQKPIIYGAAAPMPLILWVFSHIPEKSWGFLRRIPAIERFYR